MLQESLCIGPIGGMIGDLSNTEPPSRPDIILAELQADVPALLEALAAGDHSIRTLALGSLDKIGQLADSQVSDSLHDTHRDVRCRAIELSIRRPNVKPMGLLSDPDDLVVETAAWALGERGAIEPDIISALVEVGISHDVSICREAAIAALGALGDEGGLPAIMHGLEDRAPVRRRAVLALAPFDTPEVTNALERATHDRDRQVRQAAEDLL